MRLEESLKIKGHVRVFMRNVQTGIKICVEDKDNLILSLGKTVAARSLGGDSQYAGLDHISKIVFGTGGTAPLVTNTDLESEVLAKAVSVSYPAFNKAMFTATMEQAEGGSLTYQELGLKTAQDDILFSRIVISPITKSTLYEIRVEWTISFQ